MDFMQGLVLPGHVLIVDPVEQGYTENGVQAVTGKGLGQGDLDRVQVE